MIHIVAQQFDWLRFGPLSATHKFDDIQRRFSYIDVQKHNHFGSWYCDLTGDQLEVVRTVETMYSVMEWLKPIHWTRLDVAFDLEGVVLDDLACPGSAIVNDGIRQTLYSHKLKSRGDYPTFARVYDAYEAGHDVDPGIVRAEVEFKMAMPDNLKASRLFPNVAFALAASSIASYFGLVIPGIHVGESNPTSRIINHERERFYSRFGKRVVSDVLELGYDTFVSWVLDCTRNHIERD